MSIVKAYTALTRMREATAGNIPFSFSFVSFSDHNQNSNGLTTIKHGLLRTGYGQQHGTISRTLIAYYDLDKNKPGFFYLPLLLTYNGLLLCEK